MREKSRWGGKRTKYFVESCSKESCFNESCSKENCFNEGCSKKNCSKESSSNESDFRIIESRELISVR